MRTWVVAYDFSDQAKAALSLANEQLAALGGGRVVLLHANPPITDSVGLDLGTINPSLMTNPDTVVAESERLLREHSGGAPAGIVIEPRVLTGRPADTVCDVAKEVGAEQIVVGSHGRRGLERLLLGSVAERIIRLAECPVLVVKRPS